MCECMAYAGFDFTIIDSEHGATGTETATHMVRAAHGAGMPAIIRVLYNHPGLIQKAVDTGAAGVMVPQVNSARAAAEAVRAARFYPEGQRGVCCFTRAAQYGAITPAEHIARANRNTVVIVQVEGEEGVRAVEEILATPGVDLVFVGPFDLSQSLGIPGQVKHPRVKEKMHEVLALAKRAGIPVGTFADCPEDAAYWAAQGVQFMTFLSDLRLFMDGCRAFLQAARANQ